MTVHTHCFEGRIFWNINFFILRIKINNLFRIDGITKNIARSIIITPVLQSALAKVRIIKSGALIKLGLVRWFNGRRTDVQRLTVVL